MRIIDAINPRYVFRSSVTGHFVSRLYAVMHPRETIREKIANK